jgi:hypothetical protein
MVSSTTPPTVSFSSSYVCLSHRPESVCAICLTINLSRKPKLASKSPFRTDLPAIIRILSRAGYERDVFARALCAARNSYLLVSLGYIILGKHGITYFEILNDLVHTPYIRSVIIVARQRTQYTLFLVTSPSLGSLSVG